MEYVLVRQAKEESAILKINKIVLLKEKDSTMLSGKKSRQDPQ